MTSPTSSPGDDKCAEFELSIGPQLRVFAALAHDRLSFDCRKRDKAPGGTSAVRKTDDLLDAVQRSLIACLKAQLELAAAEMNTPGALKTEVREAQVPAQRKLIGRASSSLILEGVELTCQKGTSPHARMFALQFFVYRKAVVSLGGAKPKAGVIVRLEVREADGRPVSGCAAYVRREAIGRNQHKYSVTDDAPVTVECEPQQWGDQMDLLKQFVLDTVSAFPKMIEGDAKQFTLMALATKKVRFLGAALDGPLRRPAINGTVVPRWFLKVPASMATRAGAENSKRFLR